MKLETDNTTKNLPLDELEVGCWAQTVCKGSQYIACFIFDGVKERTLVLLDDGSIYIHYERPESHEVINILGKLKLKE